MDIPRQEQETADFLAYLPNCKVLIEEKTKIEDPARVAERQEHLSMGELYETSDTITRNNRLSEIVRKAASQLQFRANLDHDLRIAWITTTGLHARAKRDQCIAALYGSEDISRWDKSVLCDATFSKTATFTGSRVRSMEP